MINIKEIYQWYLSENTNAPHPPPNLTPLQKVEWDERNAQSITDYENSFKSKSFVGESLAATPAIINNIEKNKITAHAKYIKIDMSQYFFKKYKEDKPGDIPRSTFYDTHELVVNYEVLFNETLYETVKLIHNNSMVELEGEILKFCKIHGVDKVFDGDYRVYTNYYNIQLNLSKIKVIKRELLYSNLLNDTHYFYSHHKSCFIATAAFGNYDAPEVIVLRQFRDKTLLKTWFGKVFVNFYYAVSPFFATIISKSDLLKKLVRQCFLEPIVKKLQRQNKP